jgi:hypothetical protein
MTVEIIRPRELSAPAVTPLPGTLLDAATVVEGVDFLEPSNLFGPTYNCMTTDAKAVFPCPPVLLAAPVSTAPSTSTSGGTLPAGTYRAKITAYNSRGETLASSEQSQVTTGAASTATFGWNAVSGATGYRVYLTNGAANSEAVYVDDSASPYILTAWPPAGAVAAVPPTTGTAVVPDTKTFAAPPWVDGIRFAVYAGLTCKTVAFDAQAESELRRVFEMTESRGVERALMQSRFTTPAATDVTPAGGAVDPTVGVAILEGDASCKYAGLPTLHVPRVIGTLLTRNGAMARTGNEFFTVQGSKVASGAGYGCPNNGPTGAAPAAGEQWVYASGEVVVARSEIIIQKQIDRVTNETLVLVERLYVAAVDCYTAAVKVKVQ